MQLRTDSHAGFTILEMMFVILIGSVLTGVTLQAYSSAIDRFGARGALTTFASYHARSRVVAIETGATAQLLVSAAGDSIALITDGVTIDRVDLRDEFGANIVLDDASLQICMGPRGHAIASCNSFTASQIIRFIVGTDTASVEILPSGQLLY
jgi:prepilin-type N-terminal cleavage/methylation domain-containing protein